MLTKGQLGLLGDEGYVSVLPLQEMVEEFVEVGSRDLVEAQSEALPVQLA